ncbi:hypothetical protein GGR28_000734 [Lewinella aquimaris]|uniref:Asl1-like glycosyl hydrolase catalytic domain-containing protein n=1 Tax=Neolewinella aquimaris TaxID=1835722 RepID=A0A840E2E9_9BACT|nr:hypothetical protein [Neolewinella aquimaris]MBB4078133.1 hypothetical protein [Neolewinella aquimaris]
MRFIFQAMVLCGIAGAVSCHRAEIPASSETSPGRREVQRAAMRAESWQFVVCSESAGLVNYIDSLARRSSADVDVRVVGCADIDPSLPTIIFGDHLPDQLADLPQRAFGEPFTLNSDELMILNGYLNPLTVRDTMPSVVSLYLSVDTERIVRYLRELPSEWGGVFRGRWAYEILADNGSRRMGDYAGRSDWTLATDEEITLQASTKPVLDRDGVAFYAMDGPIMPERLTKIADTLLADPAVMSDVSRVYLYPSVERIGLWRGNMEAYQVSGRDLHLVPDHLDHRPRKRIPVEGFLRGMTVAHEGYRVYNGYGGSGIGPSLDSLQRMHVNSVAIVPYTFMRQAGEVGELPVPDGAGSENDPAVRFAIREARKRNCFVLLKPQIWVSGGWPGDVNFESEEKWDKFFRAYRDWIMHYGKMAEEEGVEALCIGTELVETTLGHPDAWRSIIADLRKVYSGKLTYAANWGREFEQLTFWADLDAIGLNSYYPLSTSDRPTDAELRAGAETWMHLADSVSVAFDRPLWLTEVGFRSVERAWLNPHAEAGERSASLRDQARCYDALLTASLNSERLRGMFIWKWPSYLGHDEGRRSTNTGFTPGGKPAGELLGNFYRGIDREKLTPGQ